LTPAIGRHNRLETRRSTWWNALSSTRCSWVERVVLNALLPAIGRHNRLEDKTIHLVERVVLNALLLGGTRCPQRVDPSELALKPAFAVSAG
jgi:hypothetical protein